MARRRLTDRAQKRLDERKWMPPPGGGDPRALAYEAELHRTEVELLEEELEAAHKRADRLLERCRKRTELAPANLIQLDLEGAITDVSIRAARLLGRTVAELRGQPLFDFVRPDEVGRVVQHLERVRESGESGEQRCVLQALDGLKQRVRLASRLVPRLRDDGFEIFVIVTDLEGELAPIEWLADELAAHRDWRSKLHATRTHLEAIVRTAKDAIVTFDPWGTIELVNPAAEQMFGYSARELTGNNVSSLVPPDARERYLERLGMLRDGRGADDIGPGVEVEAMHHDGSTFPIHATVAEMRVDGERKFTGILRDLTDQKELEKQVVQSQRMEAIGTLATGVAHDFNNLIMGISGCLELASRAIGSRSPAQEHLDEIRASLQGGAAISQQLLAFARQGDAKHEGCVIDETVARVRNVFGRLLGEQITLRTVTGAAEIVVNGSPGQIEQVLLNLAINARDAMRQGGTLTLETSIVDLLTRVDLIGHAVSAGEYARVVVRDTGDGIPQEVLPRIFEPFFTTKPAGQGSGLGLSMVVGTVQALGGGVRVESQPGVGTTFELFLPVHTGTTEVDPLRTGEYARLSPPECVVLVVEDDRLVAQTMRQQLVDRGHDVVLAASVAEAGQMARKHVSEIDVVLADSVLGDGFGTDVATAVREVMPDVGIIFTSAHGHDSLIRQERVLADCEFIQKPFDGTQLQRALIKTMGRASVRTRARKSRATPLPADMAPGTAVLIVDDHETARAALAVILEDEGYDVLQAASVAEALAQPLHDVGILVTDIRLPDGSGAEVAALIREKLPDTEIVFSSGLTRGDAEQRHGMPSTARFLQKPFDVEDLVALVRDALGRDEG